MKSKELKQWLRDNSSGCYRPSAQAADYIQELEECLSEAVDRIESLEAALCDIAVMPHIDQDDAHRLRNKAYVALGVPNPAIHSEKAKF